MAGVLNISGLKIKQLVVSGEANLAPKIGAKIALVIGYSNESVNCNYLGLYSWSQGTVPVFSKISGTSANPSANAQGTIQFNPESNGYVVNRWWIISLHE